MLRKHSVAFRLRIQHKLTDHIKKEFDKGTLPEELKPDFKEAIRIMGAMGDVREDGRDSLMMLGIMALLMGQGQGESND